MEETTYYKGTCSKCKQLRIMDYHDAHCGQCKNKSIISERLVMSHFLHHGYEVATPINPMSHADLIFYENKKGRWRSVQVKTAYDSGSGSRIVNLCMTTRTGRKPYIEKDAEFFAVVDGDDIYMIPFAEAWGNLRVTISNGKYDVFKVDTLHTD